MDTCGVYEFQRDTELAFIEGTKQGFSPSWKRDTFLILQGACCYHHPGTGLEGSGQILQFLAYQARMCKNA